MKPLKNTQLTPEEKVRLSIEMTETMTQVCADGIRASNPTISNKKLVKELRKRIQERR